jgi:transketolase
MDKQRKMKELRIFAEEIRVTTLKELGYIGFGHVGGAMSVVETLAVLYGLAMRYDPQKPHWPSRDKLIVSKGHAGPAVYATLALKGFFPESMLRELNQGGGNLPSHCDRNKTPGINMTTGSLGQGISAAIGVALGDRMDKSKSTTYLIVGDGELNEGQNWEGFMFAAHYRLNNLILFIDVNKQQLDGFTKDVMELGDVGAKMRAFGWNTLEVDGHSVEAISDAVIRAKENADKPSAIILDTRKGHGCSFAEGIAGNHHMNFTSEQMNEAILSAEAVLEASRKALLERG